jgi:hypothetical protein
VNVNGHFYGEDAFKFSSYTNFGSTRTIGMGGAFTALGGDAASTAINPAGLGFYNRSEFSISPVFRNVSTTSTYLDRSVSRNSDYSSIGQLGAVFNRGSSANAKRKSTFGIGFHTLANFNREYTLQGSNNRSSLMDYFAEQATFRGANPSQLDSEFDVNLGLAETPTAMYYQAYLIDPFEDQYIVAEPSFPVNQSINVSERGSLGQFSLAYAINYSDKTYFGAALGVQTLNYNVMNYHQEDFPNGEVFNSFAYDDQLLVKGTGININAGVIHKVTEDFRVGANFSSPTWMGVRETFYSGVEIDQKPNTFETEFSRIETIPGDFNYRMTSPVRLSLGAAYMLPGKIGVISADAEYVGYSNMGVKDKSNLIDDAEQNAAIASVYKDVINFKGGAELRFGKARIRGGVNYLADPMKQDNGLDRSNLILSAGAGFRGARFFADAAYTRTQFNTSYTPYTLSDPQNYASGAVENRAGVLSFTVGTFF